MNVDKSLIHYNSQLEQLEQQGKFIYHNNQFMRDIATFMENPENITFFEKYLQKNIDFEQAMLFLNIYYAISKAKPEFNGLQKIALTIQFIREPELRHVLCNHMSSWLNKLKLN